MRDAGDSPGSGRFLLRCRTLKTKNEEIRQPKNIQQCFFLHIHSRGNDNRSGRSVDERVISFQAADTGRDMALPASLGRRSCDILQIWMTAHISVYFL